MSNQVEESGAGRAVPKGAAAILEYLEGEGIEYGVVEHEPTMSALAEAEATHRPQSQVAKTVVLEDRGGYMLASVPASERLDLHKLRDLLGASKSLRLATEDEIARDFAMLEVGAVPPIGPMLPRAEVVDRRLLEEERILCGAAITDTPWFSTRATWYGSPTPRSRTCAPTSR